MDIGLEDSGFNSRSQFYGLRGRVRPEGLAKRRAQHGAGVAVGVSTKSRHTLPGSRRQMGRDGILRQSDIRRA